MRGGGRRARILLHLHIQREKKAAGEPSCETREEPGTLTQGGALFSLVPLAKPSTANVMDKYYELFRGQGGKGLERNEGMEEG
jgi:hypothetical protein